MVSYTFDFKPISRPVTGELFDTEHGHGHSHGHPNTNTAASNASKPNDDTIAAEVGGAPRHSFSLANEEHNLGDIVRTTREHRVGSNILVQHAQHNHTRLPPPTDHHANLGLFAVFIHVLGDAVNSKYATHSIAQMLRHAAIRRCRGNYGGLDHVENALAR